MRYARRTDANQTSIVEALRAAGATVKVIHQPVDLHVSAPNGKALLMEVKNSNTAYGRAGLNAKQMKETQGLPLAMVDSVEAALRAYKVLST